jgi:alpha-beta hydrolase superfamily lysophospholipase
MYPFKKTIIYTLVLVVLIPIVANTILWLFESNFVYKPANDSVGNWHPTGPQPIDIWITSKDGTRLHGWYMPHVHPKAIILYLHGNTGNVTNQYAELVKLHDKLSASVMTFDYRGYGKSAGHPDEKGIIQDAEAARDWLSHKEQVDPKNMILLGRSLGGAVAANLAADHDTKGLILMSPFLSLPDVVSYHCPILLPKLIMYNQFDLTHKISAYHGPLLVIHGNADQLIPIQQGIKLFSAARGKKWFVQINGGKHFDAIPGAVYQEIDNFIKRIH